MRRARRVALVALATFFVAVRASASDTSVGNGPPGEAADPPPVDGDTFIDRGMRHGWGGGPARQFLALTLDAGYLYFRPRASLGYGRPFTSWFGLDANPVVSGAGLGAYAGVRLSLPGLDVRVGPRWFRAFQHAFLVPRSAFGRLDLDDTTRERAVFTTYEAEITSSLPVGPGEILMLGSGSYVDGVPNGLLVFEETLRVVVDPPLVWRVRGGYQIRLGASGQHSIGLVADVLNVPKRDDSLTLRAGPVMRIVLSRAFEVRGSFVVTAVSPDRLGLVGGDFTELGVRYRFATE